jgi:DNA-binding transcriptional LysR family regulator
MPTPRTSPEQWVVLAAVVDRGGFAQAAAALHRSQSAVSYTIAQLQKALGVPLLEIKGRKAELTTHGAMLLKRARSVIDQWSRLEEFAHGLERGWESELRIVVEAAYPQARLLAVLAELKRACGNTTVSLSDAILSGSEEAITSGTADVVITSRVPAGFLGDWVLDVELVAVAAPDHPLFALDTLLTSDDLAQHTQIVIRDSGRERPRDEGWLGAQHRWTVSSPDASTAAVAAGLAYAWLPRHTVQAQIERGALRELPLAAGAVRKMPLSVVLVKPDVAGPAARAAHELFMRHAVRERVSSLRSDSET